MTMAGRNTPAIPPTGENHRLDQELGHHVALLRAERTDADLAGTLGDALNDKFPDTHVPPIQQR